jgi:hypothetical protein
LFYVFFTYNKHLFLNYENYENYENNENNENNITFVSGYWDVKNKYGKEKYNEWFKNTLKINQRYIFFCDTIDIEYIKSFRNDYETVFIDYPMNVFLTNQYNADHWIHPIHSPSKEISMIWNEKMNLMKLAKDYDIEHNSTTEFYIWIDAGIAPFRNKEPPETKFNLKDINSLPKDKIIYCEVIDDNNEKVFTGGCFIIHKNLIDEVHQLFYNQLAHCNIINHNEKCGMEQLIFTEIKKTYPDLFHKLGNGYGANIEILYNEYL